MIIRRLLVSLFLVLFASVTVGVILGLDDAARGDLAGRSPIPAEPASPAPTASPSPSLTAAARPKPTATRATPQSSTTAPSSAKPTAPATSTPTPTPTAKPKPKPTAKPTQRAAAPATKPTISAERAKQTAAKKQSRYLKGPLTKGSGGTVYLTFDDGPSPYTAQILSILSATGSTATFFHLGVNEGGFPSADAAIRKQGSKVGNHSYDHPDLTTLTKKQLRWQLQHGPRARCFRPPYGATNAEVQRAIEQTGMREVLWTIDTLDWSKPGVPTLAKTGRLKAIRNGSIILMHDGGGDRSQTVAALPTVIRELHTRGFTIRSLPSC